jgi:glycosyltransferase involved in cell wall biosynthesis
MGSHPPSARDQGKKPDVSVIVPVRDASATIGSTMRALQEQSGDYEVIVVDDASRDGSAEIARSSPLGPTVIGLPQSKGPGNARNAGVEHARAELLAFTDADCEPEPDWLAAGLRRAPEADLIQGKVVPARPAGPFDRTIGVSHETGLYETANLFVKKELFDRVGGFSDFADPSHPHGFGEDVVFGWRCRRLGARSYFAPEAVVRHAVFPRGPGGYVKERWRQWMFPELLKRVPELRKGFLFGRLFLSRQSAALDLGIAGGLLAAGLWSPWPAVAVIPYALLLAATARPRRRRAPLVAAVQFVGDLVGLVALLYGSARARTPVL